MDYNGKFESLSRDLKLGGRYRTFIALEWIVGRFPKAKWHKPEGGREDVTVWCSNDYLGIGHNPAVLDAMHEAIAREGAGTGGWSGTPIFVGKPVRFCCASTELTTTDQLPHCSSRNGAVENYTHA